MSTSNPEVFVDHEHNLCSTKKSAFLVSLLLCQVDSFLEVGVLKGLFQTGCNLCSKHLMIGESMPFD